MHAPWGDGAGVVQMARGKVRLTLLRTAAGWQSAGVHVCEVLEGHRYVLEASGRLDQMDPAAVFAVWTRNDVTGEEVDVSEATRGGDVNGHDLHVSGYYANADAKQSLVRTRPSACFNWHRYVIERDSDGARVLVEGRRPDGSWHPITEAVFPMAGKHTLRIALWCFRTGLVFTKAADQGPKAVTLESFAITRV